MERKYIVVIPEKREISIPFREQLFGVYQDKDAERKYFICPRHVGSERIDLKECRIYINSYSSAGKLLKPYHCSDVKVIDENTVTFSWLLSDELFDAEEGGYIPFSIQAKKIVDGVDKNVFNTKTAIGKTCTSVQGIPPEEDPEGYTMYEGTYEVTPSNELQVLETKNKKLNENITVNKIPTYEVANAFGGDTFIIGELEDGTE